jgi:amidase
MVHHSRRTFLQNTTGAMAALPMLWSTRVSAATAADFDPSFGTATAALAAMAAKRISARELMEHVFARIAKHNPSINAFVTLLEQQALAQAAQADDARAQGRSLGLLHGLPVLVKDAFLTAGVRTTAGAPRFATLVPTEDAVVVARLKRAGAILIGKTNLPDSSGDWQTFNTIAGRTNNPWDLTRTPGGSTGGGGAALAAGLGFLEVGSDLGSSIRLPASFCGVYGHKPTLDVVPMRGHLPPPPGVARSSPLSVAGPLARSVDDLLLELAVIGGPEDDIALRWTLPPPRKQHLRDYRIGYVLDDPFCPVDAEVKAVLSRTIEALRGAGVALVEGWPEGVVPAANYELYSFLTGAYLAGNVAPELRARWEEAVRLGRTRDPHVMGVISSYLDWTLRNDQVGPFKALWRCYFEQFDAMLMPVAHVAPFPHDTSLPPEARVLQTSNGPSPFLDIRKWGSLPTLAGLPATSAPVGQTASGLPVGLQIVGPIFEDATPLDIANKLADVIGGFERPPAYID